MSKTLFSADDLKMLEALRKASTNDWALTFSRDHIKLLLRLVEIAYELSERQRVGGALLAPGVVI